jgi:hypothetical protein
MAFATIDKGSKYFNTVTYSGNGSTQSITGVGFQPDFTWIKARSVAEHHTLNDAVRGVNKQLYSNLTYAEATQTDCLTAFNTDGFSVGSNVIVNQSSQTLVSWNWLGANTTVSNTSGSITSTVSANTTAGFSVVSYTGNATLGATVGHGLGSTCKLMIIKNRSISSNWIMYHPITLENRYMELNTTNAEAINFDYWNSTRPTSSVFTIGTANTVNGSGNSMIAYCFAEIKGYSKFGGYTGNGSADGTFVYTGFKPAFVMIKQSSSAGEGWEMGDNKRSTYNVITTFLRANSSAAESTNTDRQYDFVSNGIKMRGTHGSTNGSGSTYIYMCFAENPFVTSGGIPVTAR